MGLGTIGGFKLNSGPPDQGYQALDGVVKAVTGRMATPNWLVFRYNINVPQLYADLDRARPFNPASINKIFER
jgi:hypothetical protein